MVASVGILTGRIHARGRKVPVLDKPELGKPDVWYLGDQLSPDKVSPKHFHQLQSHPLEFCLRPALADMKRRGKTSIVKKKRY